MFRNKDTSKKDKEGIIIIALVKIIYFLIILKIFQGKYNPSGDANPQHWDIGLYVSGLGNIVILN